jgi:hypothetical protein
MKIIFTVLVTVHGLIHLMGFFKAFEYANFSQLTKDISRPMGILWLLAALLFIAAALLFLLKKDGWWIPGMIAVVISQVLIISSWQDAKFGTIANVIILIAGILALGSICFENSYRKDVKEGLLRTASLPVEMLTEADLQPLPLPVQKYLRYAGVVGKPKVNNARIVFDGQMRSRGKDFFQFTSEQYNFLDEGTRLFFMKAKMFGVTVPGYHRFARGVATMDIRFFGLFSIVKESGDVLNHTETATLFNDMCLITPASLVDKRITWEPIDSITAKATFTNLGQTISATLYFNEQGQLINFLSNDRTEMSIMKQLPFTTPVYGYQNLNGINIMSGGDAIYEYPEGKFTYGKFYLKDIEYNCK